MPSTRITHNPGTGVDHNEAGVQKCELSHSVKSATTRGGRKCYLWAPGDGCGWDGIIFCWAEQGRKASQRIQHKWQGLKD